jgi:1-acyl-sn-glycerol-3-phosphate acyltransferase
MPPHPQQQPVPAISAAHLWLFRGITRRYFRRHFRAVMIQRQDVLLQAVASGRPVLILGTHAGWWDPMVAVLLGDLLLRQRRHYAPMDAAPLSRFGILQRIGIFPVDLHAADRGMQFLRVSEAVLAANAVLWVTPQGRFADVRERPLAFMPGVALLLKRAMNSGLEPLCIPLAIEYPFWNERLPEVCLRLGDAIDPRTLQVADLHELSASLEGALARTMDQLRDEVMTRDPLRFHSLLKGAAGTGGLYAWSKKLRGLWSGRASAQERSARDVQEQTRTHTQAVEEREP